LNFHKLLVEGKNMSEKTAEEIENC